jgi:hypothetical protein
MRLADFTPAVLRLQNGWRVSGKLEVISVTGGLLSLSKPLSQGCPVKLMFVTPTGPVLGSAEMLGRLPSGLQPFKFSTLHEDARSKLDSVIRSSANQNRK